MRTGRSVMFSITKVIVTSPGATITLGCTVKSMRRLLAVSAALRRPANRQHKAASAPISAARCLNRRAFAIASMLLVSRVDLRAEPAGPQNPYSILLHFGTPCQAKSAPIPS